MSIQPTQAPPDCDIFCRVIDNYGDIGVCWRLARQLNSDHGWRVRLWVDDISVSAQLMQGTVPEGISLQPWFDTCPDVEPASVVIEAFACELPDSYLAAMAALPHPPVWLNLEYLCVEDWGPGFHLQPSPHPRLPLLKHFFVPGILPGTGGLLCEKNLFLRQQGFDSEAARRAYAADISGRWIFLFCYDNPALPLLLETWATSPTAIHCLISAGKAQYQVATWLGEAIVPGQSRQRGALHLHALPFVPQVDFDSLLWTCDLNFVRGEDSFSRALWAAQPFVWHIYPQQDNAHHVKLSAFRAAYDACPSLRKFSALWNGVESASPEAIKAAWQALDADLPLLRCQAVAWRSKLADLGNLAENLARFCQESNN